MHSILADSIPVKTIMGGVFQLSDALVTSLRSLVRGPLILPGDQAYDSVRAVWNGMIDRRPSLIVRCTGAADVLEAVKFAGEHGLLVSVRGGGHNIAGLAVADGGLMIDLTTMRGVFLSVEYRCRNGSVKRYRPGRRVRHSH